MQSRERSTRSGHSIRLEIRLQKTHKEKGTELYGSAQGNQIVLAIETCLKDGGPELVVETFLHELLHVLQPEKSETEVNELVSKYKRRYKLMYNCSLAILAILLTEKLADWQSVVSHLTTNLRQLKHMLR